MFIKKNLKHYRKKAGIKQRELATISGLSYASITQFESRSKHAKKSASFSSIAAVAAVLNVRIEDIFEFRSFLKANPFDYIDEKTELTLAEHGFNRKTWTGEKADEYSTKEISTEQLMDFLDIKFSQEKDGILVEHPKAGEVVYTREFPGVPPEPEYEYPEKLLIPKNDLDNLLSDVRTYALKRLNEIVEKTSDENIFENNE